MNSNFVKATALLALLTAFVLGSCVNPLEPSTAGNGIPAGKGVVRLETSTGAARTAVPTAAGFSRYEYWFAKDSDAAVEKTPVAGVFELDPGSYTVTVRAFAGGGADPAAQGESAPFTITGGADAGTVSVTLTPVLGEGTGTLAFTLTYPEDAELESLTLTRLAGDEPVDLTEGLSAETGLNGNTFAGEKTGIGAGYWLAQAALSRGDVYAGKNEVVHICGNVTTALDWTFAETVFTPIPVVSSADSGPGTLREALTRAEAAQGGTIFIDLPAGDRVITLTSPLPKINANLTIEGNGATLTQSGIAPGTETQLLYINATGAVVTVRRLHFKGARAAASSNSNYNFGGAIQNTGVLTLESCIFSDNQTTAQYGAGGVCNLGVLTVRGCTFYRNANIEFSNCVGIVASPPNGQAFLEGNLFVDNTKGSNAQAGFYTRKGGSITLGKYNVSTSGNPASAYITVDAGNVFNVASLLLSPVSFKPIAGEAAANALTALPDDYPAVDFYGQPITAGGASGAVQALATGYYLDYAVPNGNSSTITPDPLPDADGFYANGTTVSLRATGSSGWIFSSWTVDEEDVGSANPLSLQMNKHKTVRATFTYDDSAVPVSDEAGLRVLLGSQQDGMAITFGADISLSSVLPNITKNITIDGNGHTLTRTYAYIIYGSLFNIDAGATVSIRRLHFKDGSSSYYGAGMCNNGNLTLESCIFSGNSTGIFGGAVYTAGNLTVNGCTFYNNQVTNTTTNGRGGAIYLGGGTVSLTGNLFFGNTGGNTSSPYHVVYPSTTSVTTGGYNVSDKAAGTDAATGSGYAANATDVFEVTDIVFATGEDPSTAPSSSGGTSLKTLTALPEGFPTFYFDGTTRTTPATAGAVGQ